MDCIYTRYCDVCGRPFKGPKNQKFCNPKCCRISTEFRRNNKLETEKINRHTYPYLFRADRDEFLNKCIKNAEEMGVSYGTYMGYRNLGLVGAENEK